MKVVFRIEAALLAVPLRKLAWLIATIVLVVSTPLSADMRGIDKSGKPVILRDDGTWSYVRQPAVHGDRKAKACRLYAFKAIAAQHINQKARCGYEGTRWQLSYDGHFKWCKKAKSESRAGETKARGDALACCPRRGGKTKI